jgi:hypothetical protein
MDYRLYRSSSLLTLIHTSEAYAYANDHMHIHRSPYAHVDLRSFATPPAAATAAAAMEW